MSPLSVIRWNLGIPQLLSEWRLLFTRQGLREDIFAGSIVACVAIPLSLAIALASDLSPGVGLVTAIVAGIVCALFGGTPLAVSGPAAAMAVLVATIVEKFGMGGLLIVVIGCGTLQLLTGFFRLGFLIRLVPLPVITGFTAGIGAIILLGQLPRVLGLPALNETDLIKVVTYISQSATQISWPDLWLAIMTVLITFLIPIWWPRLPAPLFAVIVPALLAWLLRAPVQTIGAIPQQLPLPQWPTWPQANYSELLFSVFIVYALASMETLLSSSAVDKLTRGKPHDPDQELIGQGLGNIAAALFGGMPVTGVIARSALNVQAGARTRRAALIHSGFLLLSVYWLAPLLSYIPVAVLSGILIAVALRMCHPREFLSLWRTSRLEGMVYLVTFLTIVSADLLAGVQIGIIAALSVALLRLAYVKTHVHQSHVGPSTVSVNGPITFLSVTQLDGLVTKLANADLQRGVIIDFSKATVADASGATKLIAIVKDLQTKGVKVVLKGLSSACRKTLLTVGHDTDIAKCIVLDESEALAILHEGDKNFAANRLLYGVEDFKKNHRIHYGSLFKKLAEGQAPHTLFIACSDSRINPNLITSTLPGELFIIRNVGNIIPSFAVDALGAEGAAVEYAVGLLNISEIVVCAHSGCGAMQELISGRIFLPENSNRFPSIVHWLEAVQFIKQQLSDEVTAEQAAKLNGVLQMENLKTYVQVRDKLASGELKLRAWYYDIGKGELEEWDEEQKMYVPIGSRYAQALQARVSAGIQYQAPVID